jgi:hypothetical protein
VQIARLTGEVCAEQQRVAHATQLGEAQSAHLAGIANASQEEAARERARAVNCEHVSAASDRQLGVVYAEVGEELSSRINAYELNARNELIQIAASEREALRRAELGIASHEARESQEEHAAGLRARASAAQSEAYWHAEAVASATRAHR